MSRSSADAQQALTLFDPLLVQLVRDDAPLRVIISEGHSAFELRAVRTLLKRADATSYEGPAGDSTSRRPVTVGGGTAAAH